MTLTLVTILLAAGVMLVLATIMGFILGWANKAFHVPVDPRVEAVNTALPGANCGGCGYIGCGDYAEAVVHQAAAVTLCPVGGEACSQALAQIMGIEISQSWPIRPVVHCSAGYDQRLGRAEYRGEPTCQAANMVNVQGCTYGCMGFGDCVRSCDYDAIHSKNGLASVDYEKCVGCGACAKVCPRNIISMVPFKAERIMAVLCSNRDFGKEVSAVCTFGCIGCKACTKADTLFAMDGNIPQIDYEAYDPNHDFSTALQKCPRESLVWVGKPGEKDLAATADEELPERIEANFQSTLDQTEWRG